MILQIITLFAAGLVAITSGLLTLTVEWRRSIVGLAAQYVGVFILVAGGWPISIALVKLVAGWMACAIIGMAISGLPSDNAKDLLDEGNRVIERKSLRNRSATMFRLFAICMTSLLILGVSPAINLFIPSLSLGQIIGALFLIGFGLLQLSTSTKPLRVIMGLLTVLSGFEVVYSGIETATLITALLAGVNLGIAMVGAYLLVNQVNEVIP